MANNLPKSKQVLILNLLTEGMGVRATERVVDVSRETVLSLPVRVGEGCARLHNRIVRWHATTPKKFARYRATGAILPPVRGWAGEHTARAWARRVRRTVIPWLEVETAYPLPDHQPPGYALWSPDMVRERDVVTGDADGDRP